jgi:hypothetical protein
VLFSLVGAPSPMPKSRYKRPGVESVSTQGQISSPNWWVSYVLRVLHHTVRKSKDFAQLNFQILFRPTWIGANIILDDGPTGSLRAGRYFLKAFGLAFALLVVASRFQLAEGKSEWRELVLTIAQFVVAIPIIHVLCLTLPDRIPFYRLVQAGLYTAGMYLIVTALASIPIFYSDFKFGVAAGNRELDILSTAYERCLADNSSVYWLVRGDLKFYLYSDAWRPQDWSTWLFENYFYLLIIPFAYIFVRMLRTAHKISAVLICVVTATVFIAVGEGTEFVERQLGSLLAHRDFKCTSGFIDQVTKNYAPNLIARQLAYKINNDSLKTHQFFAPLVVEGANLMLEARIKSDAQLNSTSLIGISGQIHSAYCSTNLWWVAARRINYNLVLRVYDTDETTLLLGQQFTPKDCWWTGSK